MKNYILILFVAFAFQGDLFSQSKRSATSETSSIRAKRDFAINASSGFKSLSGFGLTFTKYASPHFAIDVGAGLGLQVFKTGIRGRYLFLEKNWTPYVGAGINISPLSIDDVEIELLDGSYVIDFNSSVYSQFTLGMEFVGNGGFTFGFDAGYSLLMNENIRSDNGATLSPDDQRIFDVLYGSGINLSMSIGVAF